MVNLASTPQRTPQLHVCYLVRKPDESQKANDVHIRLSVVGTQSTQVVLVCRHKGTELQKTKNKNKTRSSKGGLHIPSDTCGNVTKDLSNTLPEKQRYDAPPTAQNKVTVMRTTERLQKKRKKGGQDLEAEASAPSGRPHPRCT